jgi:hypothetical protein
MLNLNWSHTPCQVNLERVTYFNVTLLVTGRDLELAPFCHLGSVSRMVAVLHWF